MKYERADFSEAEKAYFMAAAIDRRISQTHYAGPDAETCYRCPICDKTINSNGMARNAMRHFLRPRDTPNCEYIMKLNESTNKTISFVTANIAAQRAGAVPPSQQRSEEQTEKLK